MKIILGFTVATTFALLMYNSKHLIPYAITEVLNNAIMVAKQ